jgi:integrase
VIYPEFGDRRIVDLNPRDLDEWYRKLATGEGRSRALKATSIRRHHAVLSASLSQAVRWGWLDCNPAERARPPRLERTELRVPTDDEMRSLLAAATERNERWGMLLTLAVLAGARRSELCALRQTDFDGDSVRFGRSLYRAGTDKGEKSTKTCREVGQPLIIVSAHRGMARAGAPTAWHRRPPGCCSSRATTATWSGWWSPGKWRSSAPRRAAPRST